MDYVFSARRVRQGAFDDEPGSTYFLAVPHAAEDISPAHRIGAAGHRRKIVMRRGPPSLLGTQVAQGSRGRL